MKMHWRDAADRRYRVRLNGEVVTHVVWADEEGGVLERHQTQNGMAVVNASGDDVLTEVLRGQVQIEAE